MPMRIPQPFFRKSKQSWYVQFGEKQISLGKVKETALARYTQMLRERGMTDASMDKASLHELITAYLDWVKQNREEGTYIVHCRRLDSRRVESQATARPGIVKRSPYSLLESHAANFPAENLTPAVLNNWLQKRKLNSPSTITQYIGTVSGMFNWGIRFGYVSKNPVADMPRPGARHREDFVPVERWSELLQKIRWPAVRQYVEFALNTGARPNEIRLLESAWFDRDKKRIVMPTAKSKGRKVQRVIYLNDTAFTLVEKLAKERPTGKLFHNTYDRPWKTSTVVLAMSHLKKILNMPGFCATTLRHSFAHARLTNEQDATTVAKLMGHRDTQMLNTRYGHLEGSAYLNEAANKFNAGGIAPVDIAQSKPADIARELVANHGAGAFVKCLELISAAVQLEDMAMARTLSEVSKIISKQEPPQTQLSIVG